MANYALIKDGVIDNVIVADQDFIDDYLPDSNYDDAVNLDKHSGVGIGHVHTRARNGRHTFTAPDPAPLDPVAQQRVRLVELRAATTRSRADDIEMLNLMHDLSFGAPLE